MKVALVLKKYSVEKGGLERYTVFLSRELLRAGHEIHVFANTWQPEPGIAFHHVPIIRMSSPVKNLSFAYFSVRELSKIKCDIVHSMERILRQDIFRVSDGINPVQTLQNYPNPFVRKFKEMGPRRLALHYLEHEIFQKNRSKFIMTNSKLVKEHIIEYYNVPSEKIHVIYNGIDTVRFNPEVKEKYRAVVRVKHGIRDDELLLFFASNDFKLKRLRLILNAMLLLGKRNIKLMVAGNDNKKPYVKWAATHGLEKQLIFLDHRKDMEQYYAACDVFVLPTLYDACANVCMESMACGVPVITTKTNGACELIENGHNGYVLETQNAEELAHRIESLEASTEISRMGHNGAVTARRFTMKKHIAEVLNLYDMVREKGNI